VSPVNPSYIIAPSSLVSATSCGCVNNAMCTSCEYELKKALDESLRLNTEVNNNNLQIVTLKVNNLIHTISVDEITRQSKQKELDDAEATVKNLRNDIQSIDSILATKNKELIVAKNDQNDKHYLVHGTYLITPPPVPVPPKNKCVTLTSKPVVKWSVVSLVATAVTAGLAVITSPDVLSNISLLLS
jgi:hypothetical protein